MQLLLVIGNTAYVSIVIYLTAPGGFATPFINAPNKPPRNAPISDPPSP